MAEAPSEARGEGWERSGYKLFFGIKYNCPGLRKILNYERIIQVNLKKRLLNQHKMSKIITCKVNLTSNYGPTKKDTIIAFLQDQIAQAPL